MQSEGSHIEVWLMLILVRSASGWSMNELEMKLNMKENVLPHLQCCWVPFCKVMTPVEDLKRETVQTDCILSRKTCKWDMGSSEEKLAGKYDITTV